MVLSDHPDKVEPARVLLEEYLRLPDVWESSGGVPAQLPEPFEREIRTFPGTAVPPEGDVILAVSSPGDTVAMGQFVRLEGAVCEFKRVYVRPEHRRQGIAAAVVNVMKQRARDLGYQRVVLNVMTRRTGAVALWASLGFLPCPPYRTYRFPMAFMGMDLKGEPA